MNYRIARFLGGLLAGVRAGDSHLTVHHPALKNLPQTLVLRSHWFAPGEPIPLKAAGQGLGDNISPPLEWSGVPPESKGYLLVIQDPDAPLPRPFVHLIALGIPAERRAVEPGELAAGGSGAPYGRNTFGPGGYRGPRAVPGHGPHRYVFHLMALSEPPLRGASEKLEDILAANAANITAHGVLVGTFEQL
jgi:Raf kinase inhibitor-like YbhB/YbcL family protein